MTRVYVDDRDSSSCHFVIIYGTMRVEKTLYINWRIK